MSFLKRPSQVRDHKGNLQLLWELLRLRFPSFFSETVWGFMAGVCCNLLHQSAMISRLGHFQSFSISCDAAANPSSVILSCTYGSLSEDELLRVEPLHQRPCAFQTSVCVRVCAWACECAHVRTRGGYRVSRSILLCLAPWHRLSCWTWC